MKNENGFWGIELNEQVHNLVFYKEDYYWGLNPCFHKRVALFEMNKSYFVYRYTSDRNGCRASFGQISQEVYTKRCQELRSQCPWRADGNYDDGKFRYRLQDQPEGNFSAEIYPEECFDITHKGILALLEEIAAQKEAEAHQRAAEKAARCKEYARNCGRVAKRLRISFVNVLRLGYEDEDKLKAFQHSLLAAKKKLAAMAAADREDFEHEIFGCGRARQEAALEALGVKTFEADVHYMDFSELGK